MWHFSLFLGLLLHRREQVQTETEFLGFEAYTRPAESDGTEAAAADKASPKVLSSSAERVLKAA